MDALGKKGKTSPAGTPPKGNPNPDLGKGKSMTTAPKDPFNFRECSLEEKELFEATLVKKFERVERSAEQTLVIKKTNTFGGVKARLWSAVRHKPAGHITKILPDP